MTSFLRGIYESQGSSITLRNHLTDFSLNIISRMVLGKKYTQVSTKGSFNDTFKAKELKEMIDEWFLLNGVLNIGDLIPQLGFLDLQGYEKRMKKLGEKFDILLEQVLDEHNERKRCEGEEFVVKDMVDLLLQLADDPNADPDLKLPRDGIKAFTVVCTLSYSYKYIQLNNKIYFLIFLLKHDKNYTYIHLMETILTAIAPTVSCFKCITWLSPGLFHIPILLTIEFL